MERPILGYWDFRGIAEPIRFLLRYKNVDFEDRKHPILEKDRWYANKFNYGLDFPNLPYYIDGTVKLTQTITIMRYLAQKYDLDGKTEEDRLRVSLFEQQVDDLRARILGLVYNKQYAILQPDFEKSIPVQLKLYETFLGNRKFFAGDYLTYVDFMAYEIIDFCRLYIPKVLNGFPYLKSYQERIKNLPGLKQYLQSSDYKSWPILAPSSHFGGKGPEPKDE